jgi:hypothetical protein
MIGSLAVLALLAAAVTGSPEATATFRFDVERTVAVVLRACGQPTRELDVAQFHAERYAYAACALVIETAAITNYELRVLGEAAVLKESGRVRIPVAGLQVRLVEATIRGMGCAPAVERVVVNPEVTRFMDAVESPDSILLFSGCNNASNPGTTVSVDLRVDLEQLPAGALSAGDALEYVLTLLIVER